MKKVLLFPMVLISCLCFAQEAKDIIGKPIKIGNYLLVAQNDFPIGMIWDDANKACAALGDEWRLPTQDELNILYQNKDKIGGFSNNFYWSSKESDNNLACYQYFSNGFQNSLKKTSTFFVRAVNNRDSTQMLKSKKVYDDSLKSQIIIGKPIKIGNLLITEKDFPNEMNWDDANKACAVLGDGWRLPTQDELNILYQNKDKIGGFSNNFFWSSTVYSDNMPGYQYFEDGRVRRTKKEANNINVRAVKTNSAQAAQFEKQYKTIDLNDNDIVKTDKGKKVEAASELPPNMANALKRLTNKIDRDYLLKIIDKPDPENKDGDICGTTTTGCYWCNKRVQISKFYHSRGKELYRTFVMNNFGFELDLKSELNKIRKSGMYYCEAKDLTWNKYYCSRNCEYMYQKSKKGF
jgi:hypothetical protein